MPSLIANSYAMFGCLVDVPGRPLFSERKWKGVDLAEKGGSGEQLGERKGRENCGQDIT